MQYFLMEWVDFFDAIKAIPEEEPVFKFEYEVTCFNEDGKEIDTYFIEADNSQNAEMVAREFCNDDYPNTKIGETFIISIRRVKI